MSKPTNDDRMFTVEFRATGWNLVKVRASSKEQAIHKAWQEHRDDDPSPEWKVEEATADG